MTEFESLEREVAELEDRVRTLAAAMSELLEACRLGDGLIYSLDGDPLRGQPLLLFAADQLDRFGWSKKAKELRSKFEAERAAIAKARGENGAGTGSGD